MQDVILQNTHPFYETGIFNFHLFDIGEHYNLRAEIYRRND
jgi:hypothetical protein